MEWQVETRWLPRDGLTDLHIENHVGVLRLKSLVETVHTGIPSADASFQFK